MPKYAYIVKRFNKSSKLVIQRANTLIEEYSTMGYSLTLRQLYYRFVGNAWIPNTLQSYKRLGSIVGDARLAGLIDWRALQDRTRFLRGKSFSNSPVDLIRELPAKYHTDRWQDQPSRIEVWVEKDALIDVVSRACSPWSVDYFSCRGYVSLSTMWQAAQRLIRYANNGQSTIILHMGDHDPSGLDMTRDIQDRLTTFQVPGFSVRRVALNLDQVEGHQLPPNPAKIKDPRCKRYIEEHGNESWELDALPPNILHELVDTNLRNLLANFAAYERRNKEEKSGRTLIAKVAEKWDKVAKFVSKPANRRGKPVKKRKDKES